MNRNERLRFARLWLHDFTCIDGDKCTDRVDHARRRFHQPARQVVDGNYRDLVFVCHNMFHPNCPKPIDGHVNFEHPKLLALAKELRIEPVRARVKK